MRQTQHFFFRNMAFGSLLKLQLVLWWLGPCGGPKVQAQVPLDHTLVALNRLADAGAWESVRNGVDSLELGEQPILTQIELLMLRGQANMRLQATDAAVRTLEQARALSDQHCGANSLLSAKIWNSLGNAYILAGRPSEARTALWHGMAVCPTLPDSARAKMENSLGFLYQDEGRLDSSRYYFKKAIAHWSAYPEADPINRYYPMLNLAAVLPSAVEKRQTLLALRDSLAAYPHAAPELRSTVALLLGESYLESQISDSAQWYLEAAERSLTHLPTVNPRLNWRVRLLLGQFWQQSGDAERAARYFRAAEVQLPDQPTSLSFRAEIELAEVRQLISQGVYDLAAQQLQALENELLASGWRAPVLFGRIQLLLGRIYLEQQAWDFAENYLLAALDQLQSDATHANRALLALAALNRERQQYDRALEYLQTARRRIGSPDLLLQQKWGLETGRILSASGAYRAAVDTLQTALALPVAQQLEGPWVKLQLYEALSYHYYEQVNDLPTAYTTVLQGLEVLAAYQQDQLIDENRYMARYRFERLYALGIRSAVELAQEDPVHLREAVYLLERSKSLLLNEIQPTAGIDWAKASDAYVRSIQAELDQTTALLSYFWHPGASFAFLIRADTLLAVPIENTPAAYAAISEYYQLVSTTPWQWDRNMDEKIERTHALAHELYQRLWEPLEADLPDRVVIIPDHVLHFLPFSCLEVNAGSGEYLVERYELSLHFSPQSWYNDRQQPPAEWKPHRILAFAPDFSKHSQLIELPNSERELAAISEYFSGQFLTGEKATEAAFRVEFTEADVLHFATHGLFDNAQPEYSYLAFAEQPDTTENEYLYVQEIEAISDTFDLVMMSACETALGPLYRGEGLLSLARSFYRSGARNVIATQWRVDDQTSATIVTDFYSALHRGLRTPAAMQTAQRTYLQQATGTDRHPYYWAAYLHYGTGTILNPSPRTNYVWWGVAVVGLLSVGWIYFRFFKKDANAPRRLGKV